MVTYIKRNVPGYYIELQNELDPKNYSNIGSTYEDFQKGLYVKLSEEQVKFREENPTASVKEVWDMEINVYVEPERTLEQAKMEKLNEIDMYDNSDAVNGFTINGAIPAWFNPSERTNYALSINAAKLLGQETLTFAVGDNVLQVATNKAEMMLSAIQLYADGCYMITKQHKMTVEALDSIEAVDAYDYTTGYPEKLNFELA